VQEDAVSKPFPFLFVLSTLFVPVRALALPTQATYRATLNGSPAGLLRFELDGASTTACTYDMDWESDRGLLSDQCVLDEATWAGHRDCEADALRPEESILTLSPDWGCWGFDPAGGDNEIFLMVLGENRLNGALDGLIQLDSASSPLYGFRAVPLSSLSFRSR
jgi:hypothetical protein